MSEQWQETAATLRGVISESTIKGLFTEGNAELRENTRDGEAVWINPTERS